MIIEISEKGSEAFYREVVNVCAQYRYILKNHHHKLKDYFKQFKVLLVLGAVFFVLLLLTAVFWGAGPWGYAILAALGISTAMCAVYLQLLNKLLRSMLADARASVLSFDDSGVELNKGGSQVVKLGWDNVAVVCAWRESLSFLSADHTGIVISVTRRYAAEILDWLRANQPTVELVESPQ